jgi:hypothetical protein
VVNHSGFESYVFYSFSLAIKEDCLEKSHGKPNSNNKIAVSIVNTNDSNSCVKESKIGVL